MFLASQSSYEVIVRSTDRHILLERTFEKRLWAMMNGAGRGHLPGCICKASELQCSLMNASHLFAQCIQCARIRILFVVSGVGTPLQQANMLGAAAGCFGICSVRPHKCTRVLTGSSGPKTLIEISSIHTHTHTRTPWFG